MATDQKAQNLLPLLQKNPLTGALLGVESVFSWVKMEIITPAP